MHPIRKIGFLEALGPLLITSGVDEWMNDGGEAAISDRMGFVTSALSKFYAGNWGDTDPQDSAMNDEAAKYMDGSRILASYRLPESLINTASDSKIWICADGVGKQSLGVDYCHHTILWPSEY